MYALVDNNGEVMAVEGSGVSSTWLGSPNMATYDSLYEAEQAAYRANQKLTGYNIYPKAICKTCRNHFVDRRSTEQCRECEAKAK